MGEDSTPRAATQREDYIDYRVSDLYRDHYAAQGLTYPSGRCQRKPSLRVANWNDEIDAAKKRIAELELDNRLLRLENAQLHRNARVPDQGPIRPAAGGHASTVFQGVVECDASGENADAPG